LRVTKTPVRRAVRLLQCTLTVQHRLADRSQVWLASDVTQQDDIVPLTIYNMARVTGRGAPRTTHTIIYLLLAIEF
jgi:hypothetical protein